MAQPDATTLTKVVSVPLSVVVPQAQENGPQADDGTLSLPCGTDLPFRTIQPDDVDALLRFHERLGERTIYLRFFGSMKELSKEKAKYLATVDGVDHVALVALDPEDSHEIVAIVRYDREPEDEKAEYAALVEDRWQEHGVGIALTRELEQPQRPGVHLETLYTGPRSANRCDR